MNINFSAIEEMVKNHRLTYEKKFQKVIENLTIDNDGLEPTIDRNHRLHAPAGGYFIEDAHYVGGEYLPFPELYEDELIPRVQHNWDTKKYRGRMKVSLEDSMLIEQQANKFFQEFGDALRVSHGNTWYEDGVQVCYVYFNSRYADVHEQIEKDIRAQGGKSDEDILEERLKKEEERKQNVAELTQNERITIEGVMIGTKVIEGYYGFQMKMLVELDDGNRIWSTLPKGLCDDDKGSSIRFDAKLMKKEDGFYIANRPSKAKVI